MWVNTRAGAGLGGCLWPGAHLSQGPVLPVWALGCCMLISSPRGRFPAGSGCLGLKSLESRETRQRNGIGGEGEVTCAYKEVSLLMNHLCLCVLKWWDRMCTMPPFNIIFLGMPQTCSCSGCKLLCLNKENFARGPENRGFWE